jgi:hypothetical protein
MLNYDLMEPIEYYSTLLTFFYSVILIILPFVCAIYLHIYSQKILDKQLNDREGYKSWETSIGGLWERLDLRKGSAVYYNSIFVIRRFLLGISLVFMRDYIAL